MKFFKNITKEKAKTILMGLVVTAVVLVSIFSQVLFPGSWFSNIIDNSIGKFFNLADFFSTYYIVMIESVTIIFFMWVINKIVGLFISFITKKGSKFHIAKGAKSQVVMDLIKNVIKYVTFIAALFLILNAWGVQTQTLLAGAGIVALAVSFGAQSLIEDIISGLFLVFEKQFSIGDVIEVNDFRGTVIGIGLRITKIEDIYGDIKMINNSEIRGAVNTSSHLSLAICDIAISYNEDIKKVEKIIEYNLPQMKENIKGLKEGPFYMGVQKLADSSVILRVYAKTHESKRYQVTRDLNREMKLLFDANKISIPFPQVVVHSEKQNDKK